MLYIDSNSIINIYDGGNLVTGSVFMLSYLMKLFPITIDVTGQYFNVQDKPLFSSNTVTKPVMYEAAKKAGFSKGILVYNKTNGSIQVDTKRALTSD